MVVPLVVYHGATRWPGPRRFSEGLAADEALRPHLLDFPFEILDVGHVPVPTLSQTPPLRGGLLLLRYAIRYPAGQPVEALERMLKDLAGMSDSFLVAVSTYMFSQFIPASREELRMAIHRAMPEKEERMISRALAETLAEGREQGLKEGLEQGLKQGEEKGRAAGKAQILRRQLERKLGPLPDERREQIVHAPESDLDLWIDRVLDAKNLEDVFGEPRR